MSQVDVLNGRIASRKDAPAFAASTETSRAPDFAAFLAECDETFVREFGIAYTKIGNSIHPELEMAKSAFDEGQSSLEFAADTGHAHGFKSVATLSRDGGNATKYNEVAVLISEFVGTDKSQGWQRRDAGAVVYPMIDGYAQLSPIKNRDDGNYGFCIAKRDGGVLDSDGYFILDEGLKTEQWASKDLGDVLSAFQADIAPTYMAYSG